MVERELDSEQLGHLRRKHTLWQVALLVTFVLVMLVVVGIGRMVNA
jgi:hypothetical protein